MSACQREKNEKEQEEKSETTCGNNCETNMRPHGALLVQRRNECEKEGCAELVCRDSKCVCVIVHSITGKAARTAELSQPGKLIKSI